MQGVTLLTHNDNGQPAAKSIRKKKKWGLRVHVLKAGSPAIRPASVPGGGAPLHLLLFLTLTGGGGAWEGWALLMQCRLDRGFG